jgi:hypothetical protein
MDQDWKSLQPSALDSSRLPNSATANIFQSDHNRQHRMLVDLSGPRISDLCSCVRSDCGSHSYLPRQGLHTGLSITLHRVVFPFGALTQSVATGLARLVEDAVLVWVGIKKDQDLEDPNFASSNPLTTRARDVAIRLAPPRPIGRAGPHRAVRQVRVIGCTANLRLPSESK